MRRKDRTGCSSILITAAVVLISCVLPCQAAGGWSMHGAALDGNVDEDEYVIKGLFMENVAEGITVESDLANWHVEEGLVEFLDRVRITQDGTLVQADSGCIDRETNAGTFTGSVSLLRSATDDDPYEIRLTCDELDLDTATDSFVARRNPVIRRTGEDGEEVVLRAELVEYDGATRIMRLTEVAEMSAPGLPAGAQVSAKTVEFNTQTGDVRFFEFVINEDSSEETEEQS